MLALRRSVVAAALVFALTGCITTSPECIDRCSEPRVAVQFENTEAARLFAEASRQDSNPDETESYCLACLLRKRWVIPSDAGRFNYAAGRCDTNQDRVITYAEAWYYWNLMK